MKSLEEGGDVAPESIAVYEQQLAALNAHVTQVQDAAERAIAHERGAKLAASEAALQGVLAQVPPHIEDLAVIEAINKCMIDARRCVHAPFVVPCWNCCLGHVAMQT